MAKRKKTTAALPKTPTGIKGFDEITFGGLPKGRVSLVAGAAGSGKTLFGMEFLVRGATEFKETGVFVSFEESEKDLASNFLSLGFDLEQLKDEKKIALDYVRIDRSEIEETGEYDLAGLFVRLGFAIDSIGAKRVVLDTIEALFSGFSNESVLRAEIRRLFGWLKERGVTALVTAERGSEGHLTRHGLEEYVSDCVIALDHRVTEQISTRRLRVVKYRGSAHGTNEYPFLLDEGGISVIPITSVGLDYEVSTDRISTGIDRLDAMFGGKGYFRGSSVLISGTAGSGKTSFAAQFAASACARGERCIYFAFEESSSQIMRNMRSVGLDLARLQKKGSLRFMANRPTAYGLEMHLAKIHKTIYDFRPSAVVLDPITNLTSVANTEEVKIALMRLVDLLKSHMITSLFTSLLEPGRGTEDNQAGVSSLMDTWVLLAGIKNAGETRRTVQIVKSRGMKHSGQQREFSITDQGIGILDVYTGSECVSSGPSRRAKRLAKATAANKIKGAIERRPKP